MDNIVYILGAGFSAPLGLPLMSNFWLKASQLARSEPELGTIDALIDRLKSIDAVRGYYRHEMHNLEEALSVIEMQDALEGKHETENFKKMIAQVIASSTKEMPIVEPTGFSEQNWLDTLFGRDANSPLGGTNWPLFGHFVGSLLGLQLRLSEVQNPRGGAPNYICKVVGGGKNENNYSVITLNYDTILEKVCEFMNRTFLPQSYNANFASESKDEPSGLRRPPLIHLHGSINAPQDIILPTYNKAFRQSAMPPSWRSAKELLMKANQIRMIGYSLPQSDTYIKYLLKAALGKRLEKFDILCLDDEDHTVEKRYEDFVEFQPRRFLNKSTEEYLGELFMLRGTVASSTKEFFFDKLERVHSEFFH